jgi:hypothetical protein
MLVSILLFVVSVYTVFIKIDRLRECPYLLPIVCAMIVLIDLIVVIVHTYNVHPISHILYDTLFVLLSFQQQYQQHES